MTYQISTRIEHTPTELGQQGFASLVMFANGQRIAHRDFGCDRPTDAEVVAARWSLAYHLYHNRHFAQYAKALYWMAYPYGE